MDASALKFVILDRDGVINKDSEMFIKSPDEWTPLPGSLEAIARLNNHGYKVVVASNQSGVGRGLFDIDMLNSIHNKMLQMLSTHGGNIEAIFFCPHSADSRCECRKPKIGMFRAISDRFNVPTTDCFTVGDSLRDLQAGLEAGCTVACVRSGKGEHTIAEDNYPKQVPIYKDLADWVDAVIEGRFPSPEKKGSARKQIA